MDHSAAEIPQAETLFAAALYLAAQYARTGCPLVCSMIMRQLACIENHPDASVSGSLRETCQRLRRDWERIGCERAHALREAACRDGEARDPRQVH